MESLFIGIISGVCASVIFALVLFLIRPKLKISDKISVEKIDNRNYLVKVKVVNLSFFYLMDVDYTLEYCTSYGDGINDVRCISPRKEKLRYLKKNVFDKDDTDNAVRISYIISSEDYRLNDGDKLIFTISGRHSFSNTSICEQREYHKADLIEGVFETAESTKIIHDKK